MDRELSDLKWEFARKLVELNELTEICDQYMLNRGCVRLELNDMRRSIEKISGALWILKEFIEE